MHSGGDSILAAPFLVFFTIQSEYSFCLGRDNIGKAREWGDMGRRVNEI
jgi:hypothetical protein